MHEVPLLPFISFGRQEREGMPHIFHRREEKREGMASFLGIRNFSMWKDYGVEKLIAHGLVLSWVSPIPNRIQDLG